MYYNFYKLLNIRNKMPAYLDDYSFNSYPSAVWYSPYAARHFKAMNDQQNTKGERAAHAIIGFLESIQVLGTIASLFEFISYKVHSIKAKKINIQDNRRSSEVDTAPSVESEPTTLKEAQVASQASKVHIHFFNYDQGADMVRIKGSDTKLSTELSNHWRKKGYEVTEKPASEADLEVLNPNQKHYIIFLSLVEDRIRTPEAKVESIKKLQNLAAKTQGACIPIFVCFKATAHEDGTSIKNSLKGQLKEIHREGGH